MTTSAAGDDHRPSDPIVFRIIHYRDLILLGLATQSVLSHYFPSLALLIVGLALLVALLLGVFGVRRHNRSLCVACAGEFPPDATEQANGPRRPALQRFHFSMNRAVIVLTVLGTAVVASFWVWWLAPASLVAFAVQAHDSHQHRLLELYCPFCHRGPGDDDGPDPDPVPTPDPAIKATR